MNKKLMAVAVAGALAVPGVAFAQASSVTISGIFKVGLESLNYSNTPAGVTRLNSSQMRVVDNSSRIIFNVTEDLGNSLSAVAQLDVRFAPDQASQVQTSNPIGSGNTWVGLSSTKWGRVTMGRHDLHYGIQSDDTAAKAGALQASAISVFDYINGTAIANGTRTQNVVRYDLPSMNGFNAVIAWSANPVGSSELDMLNTTAAIGQQSITPGAIPGSAAIGAPLTAATVPSNGRKGDGWNINPSYANGPFKIGYSYWRAKPDAPVATTNDQRGDTVYGHYQFGGFKIGLGWNRSKLENSTTGTKAFERDAWSVPMSYVWGPHNVVGHYTVARNADNAAGTISNSGAKMFSIAYVYDLSKRTSVGLTFSELKNDTNASYNFFTTASLGSTDAVTVAGERARLLQASIKHAF